MIHSKLNNVVLDSVEFNEMLLDYPVLIESVNDVLLEFCMN